MNNKVKIKVIGKNINNFILKLHNKNINIYNIYKKNSDCVYLIIDYKSFDEVIKYKTYYDVYIVDYLGPIKIKNNIKKNKFVLIFLILALFVVFFLSRLTFKVNIITNDQKIANILLDELKQNGIHKYAFLKNYSDIKKIKEKIQKKYPKLFEWLEIERIGTGYNIRFEKRMDNHFDNDSAIYDIIALKDAYILALNIESGNIVKNINEYVKKGDVIVSSDIMLNDEIKGSISAKGHVYGEVWYKVSVNLPNNYYKQEFTGNSVNTYSLNIFSFKYIFDKSKFNDKIIISIPIIKNKLFPISFNKENIKEITIDKKTERDKLAIELVLNKIKSRLKEKEEIIDYFVLEKKQNKDSLSLSLFISVKEEIGVLKAR